MITLDVQLQGGNYDRLVETLLPRFSDKILAQLDSPLLVGAVRRTQGLSQQALRSMLAFLPQSLKTQILAQVLEIGEDVLIKKGADYGDIAQIDTYGEGELSRVTFHLNTIHYETILTACYPQLIQKIYGNPNPSFVNEVVSVTGDRTLDIMTQTLSMLSQDEKNKLVRQGILFYQNDILEHTNHTLKGQDLDIIVTSIDISC